MFAKKGTNILIDDSMFLSLDQFNSKEVKEKIVDKDQHQKTVRHILTNVLKEKIRDKK